MSRKTKQVVFRPVKLGPSALHPPATAEELDWARRRYRELQRQGDKADDGSERNVPLSDEATDKLLGGHRARAAKPDGRRGRSRR